MIRNSVLKGGRNIVLLSACLYLTTNRLSAQSYDTNIISLDEISKLAFINHPQIKIVERSKEIATQDKRIAEMERLPQILATANLSYTGDTSFFDRAFHFQGKSDNIHFGQHMGLEVYQLLYNGNRIKRNLESKDLVIQLAQFDLESNKQDIKLLVSSYYIELYNLENQENVYIQNIELAKSRIKQINSLFKQGMITNDDVIRSELQLSELLLKREQIQTRIEIVNNQLLLATGLKRMKIKTDSSFLNLDLNKSLSEVEYIQKAQIASPALRSAQLKINIQEKNLHTLKTDRFPTIYAFSSNNMDRPIRTVSPQQDLYSNLLVFGLGLKYNLSTLYTIRTKIKLQEIYIDKAKDSFNYEKMLTEQKISDYNKLEKLAWSQWETYKKNERLAAENYRITEKKYFNQLSLFIDLFNASNLKLEAELKSATAHAEAVYSYYKLLNTVGTLE